MTVCVSFTVSGGHVRFVVRRGPDFDALVRASEGAIEFVGDAERARMRLVRLVPRTARGTRAERDPAARSRAAGGTEDALARATDSASKGDGREARMAAYRRRGITPSKAKARPAPKMSRGAPIPPAPDAFIQPPTKGMLMGAGRPVSSLSRGGV